MACGKKHYMMPREKLDELFSLLRDMGYQVIGPKKLDLGVSYEEISSLDEMPIGYVDDTKPGYYRLVKVEEPWVFGTLHGQCNWKRHLYPVEMVTFKAKKENGAFQLERVEHPVQRKAFFGVRPCDLSAIKVLDKVLLGGPFVDHVYKANRENTLIIVANCTRTSDTCFCASLDTGPRAKDGYDLALTEIIDSKGHRFLVTSDSTKGEEIISKLGLEEASEEDVQLVRSIYDEVRSKQTRKVYVENVKEILYENMDSPRWEDLDKRCLGCGNCTMVCPTCFCTTVYDYTSFTGDEAWRVRLIDSCFTLDYSYIHGGSIRKERKFTYRHWLTHKYATWQDQFGVLGCVGCGRCITWCPVGIAINEEVNYFTAKPATKA